jgi:hypothetical protein
MIGEQMDSLVTIAVWRKALCTSSVATWSVVLGVADRRFTATVHMTTTGSMWRAKT